MKTIYKILMNRETMLYLVFGVGTTFVNFMSFALFQLLLGEKNYLFSNILSFVSATTFAFITNKQWVFESKEWKFQIVIKEAIVFVSARISTFLIIEELGLLFCVQILTVNRLCIANIDGIMLAKVFLAFVAVLANYILSKLCVFRQGSKDEKGTIDNSSI